MVRVPAQRSLAAALLAAAVCLAGLAAVPPRALAAARPATPTRCWSGTWTLPAGTRPRIGLISHGGAGAVAEFDYIRIYQP
jgi:hypothetical protein